MKIGKMKKILTEWRKYLKEEKDFDELIRDEYGVELWLTRPHGGDEYVRPYVTLESIVIPKDKRGQGLGSIVMQRVIEWADDNQYILSLTPSADFGGKVTKLRKFYGRFGFVKNLGRNKDFRTRDAMIRYPGGKR